MVNNDGGGYNCLATDDRARAASNADSSRQGPRIEVGG